jgi:hypothetical protein
MHELTKGESMFTIQKLLINFLEHILFFGNWSLYNKISFNFQ